MVSACIFLPSYISKVGILVLPYLVRKLGTRVLLFVLYLKLKISTMIKIVHMTLVLKGRRFAKNIDG